MSDTTPAHILVVDDELFIRESIQLYLESSGFRVDVADGGESALRIFAGPDSPVDVVILDLVMPGTHGMDLLREFKKRDPSVEVIIATGCGSMNSAIEALRIGAFDYITKPIVDFDEDLLRSVQRAVSARAERLVPKSSHRGRGAPGESTELLRLRRQVDCFTRLDRFVREHLEEPVTEATWSALWNLLEEGIGATAALFVLSGADGQWRPVKSWGFQGSLDFKSQGVSRARDDITGRILGGRGPTKRSKVVEVPIPAPGTPLRGELLLLLFFDCSEESEQIDLPAGLLSAAVGAALRGKAPADGAHAPDGDPVADAESHHAGPSW